MSKKKERFDKNKLRKLIIPLIIEQALAFSIGMIDTIMVASVGESAVSGVSLVDSINFLFITLFTALATGGAIVAGQYLGMMDKKNSNNAAKQLVIVTFLLSTLVMILCITFNNQILSLIFGEVDADVFKNARTYFYMTTLAYPFIAVYNAAAALFRGMGNSKVSMVNSLIMNIVNIVGNSIFIFGFKWGVFGAAFATLLSRIIASISMLRMLRDPSLEISVTSYGFKDFDFKMIKKILRIGIPNGLENSVFQIGKIIMTSLVASFGTSAIAAHAVAGSLSGIGIIPGAALGLALMSIVAQCIGADEQEQAKKYTKKLLKQAWLYMTILNLVILVILKPVLQIYNLSEDAYSTVFRIMWVYGIGAILFWTPSFALPNALRAAGDVKFPMTISILSMFIFRIGCGYLLGYTTEVGVLSVWIAMVIDWVFRGFCFLLRWRSGKWKSYSVIKKDIAT